MMRRGPELRQHLADRIKLLGMDGAPVWQASFRDMQADDLPPGDGVVQIYPVFMQSGWTVTEALPEQLSAMYAERGVSPEFEFKPVWGAGEDVMPLLTVRDALGKELGPGTSLLVVAHGVVGKDLPPEPFAFLQKLRAFLWPQETDMALAYFGASPSVEEVFPRLKGNRVVVLPFLIGEGKQHEGGHAFSGIGGEVGQGTGNIASPGRVLFAEGAGILGKGTLRGFREDL